MREHLAEGDVLAFSKLNVQAQMKNRFTHKLLSHYLFVYLNM